MHAYAISQGFVKFCLVWNDLQIVQIQSGVRPKNKNKTKKILKACEMRSN